MDRVEEAAGQGHAVVELPPQPAEKRQHDGRRHQHAPQAPGQYPVESRAVEHDQHDRQRIGSREPQDFAPVALIEQFRLLDVGYTVGTHAVEFPSHQGPRRQTQQQQSQQHPGPVRIADAIRLGGGQRAEEVRPDGRGRGK